MRMSSYLIAAAWLVAAPGVVYAQGAEFKGTRLNATGFGGILEDATVKAWAQPFEKATGASVSVTNPVSYSKIKAQVDAGNVVEDVAHVDAFFVQANCGTLFEKIDTAALAEAGVRKEYLSNECGLPIAPGSILLAYNTERFGKNPPTSWDAFFDVEKYPGRRAIWNFVQNGALEMALLADGVPADKLYPLDLDRAFKKLDTIKSNLRWVQSTGALAEALVNEDVDMALIFSGRAYAAVKAGAPVAQVFDQQIVYWDNVGIVKGTKNLAAAKAYVRFGASPDVQAKFVEISSYGSVNTLAKPAIDEQIAAFQPLNPKTAPTAVFLNQDWWAKNFDAVNQRFVDWQSR